jgi:hypothetical protein
MKSKKQPEGLTRDNLLKILSDEEVARVSLRETAASLVDGDEFIDLTQIELGVQRAGAGVSSPTLDVLSRKVVHENTWRKIVANLTARRSMAHVPAPPSKPQR